MSSMQADGWSRRAVLTTGAGIAGAGLAGLTGLPRAARATAPKPDVPLGKAEHCVMVWLGGGMGQIDTFDPKRLGDPKKRTPGSYYPSIPTAIRGERVCQHLSRCADLMDRFTIVRTVHHDVINEHAAATNRMHTGRPTSGTIVYPSIGSIVAHQRGAADENVPPYVVIGYPNLTRGPGFLGARHGFVYLTDTQTGPAALTPPKDITKQRRARRDELLAALRRRYVDRHEAEKAIADYDATAERAYRLSGREFMSVFNLEGEPKSLRQRYGGEFGQRCLLARRLIQSGVRFIEVSHNLGFVNGTGWDVHREGILKQHLLIEELDTALSSLVTDLEDKGLLDKTLIVVSGEFGRPGGFDNAGGRGHHAKAFSVVLAGGGINNGTVVGQTDDIAEKIVAEPVGVPDLFATVFNTLGIDPHTELYAGDRPVPITDMGEPIRRLFV